MPITNALVSDFDGDSGMPELLQTIMPGGKWDDDVDGTGTLDNTSIKFEPCGTNGTGMHFIGMGHTKWGAAASAAIIDQLNPADVSRYSGISFVVKSAAGLGVIFKVQNPYSQPGCGKCVDSPAALAGEECYSGYAKTVPTTTDATPTVVRWTELTQQTWGYKPLGTAAFDPKQPRQHRVLVRPGHGLRRLHRRREAHPVKNQSCTQRGADRASAELLAMWFDRRPMPPLCVSLSAGFASAEPR